MGYFILVDRLSLAEKPFGEPSAGRCRTIILKVSEGKEVCCHTLPLSIMNAI